MADPASCRCEQTEVLDGQAAVDHARLHLGETRAWPAVRAVSSACPSTGLAWFGVDGGVLGADAPARLVRADQIQTAPKVDEDRPAGFYL